MPGESNETASFNQAFYQQQRINELFLRVDRLSIDPLEKTYGIPNYQSIFNDLCSVLLTISSKLSKIEKDNLTKMRSDIQNSIYTSPIYVKGNNGLAGKTKFLMVGNWNTLNESLFQFRMEIELNMDIHGFGNPSKDDPNKAVMT